MASITSIRNLHILSTYVLLCLGTWGLWMGEADGTIPYPVFVIICAMVAYGLTDQTGLLRLPHSVCNLLAIVILFVTGAEFLKDTANAVIALAHFLVYLQVVKFFRQKIASDYWQLYALNILQLSIACVINREMGFGMLLLLYALLAVGVLMLFHLRRHENLMSAAAGRGGELSSNEAPRSLWLQWAILGAVGVPLGFAIFWFIPRTGQAAGGPVGLGRTYSQLTTGFSDSVRLDELGTIMESDEVVFNAWVTDKTGASAPLPGDVLWRGMVFTRYRDKQWRASPRSFASALLRMSSIGALSDEQVLISIEHEINTQNMAFFPRPIYAAESEDEDLGLHYLQMESRLVVPEFGRRTDNPRPRSAYRVVTHKTAFAYRDPQEIAPTPEYLDATRQLDEPLPTVREMAARLIADLDPADTAGKIKRINDYLTDPAEFSYTLDIRPVDATLDPVEDFLLNRKEGHCEYFASSLALMLRAAGVSTRVINGFKGADYNRSGRYYQVRQLLAHSWVEAYLPEDRYWMTLDPTPTQARAQQVELRRSPFQSIREMVHASRYMWNEYVIGYTEVGQRDLARAFGLALLGLALMVVQGIWFSATGLVRRMLSLQFWLTWEGAALAAGLVMLALLGYWYWEWIGSRLRRLAPHRRRRLIHEAVFPLYERWVVLLARRGLRRRPAQTALEFADSLAERWQESETTKRWSKLPVSIVDLLYALRFGRKPIDQQRLNELDQEVSSFANRR